MKDYIIEYNNRPLSYEINTHNRNSLFAQPQKEIIAQAGEIIKFSNTSPNTIEKLDTSNKTTYNPYGKKYVPYNEKFIEIANEKIGSTTTLTHEKGTYIDIILPTKYTIIGIGIKCSKYTPDINFKIGYGYNKYEQSTGFFMNYIFNNITR